MTTAASTLSPFLETVDPDQKPAFEQAVAELGFNEPSKTVTNLLLLRELLDSPSLVTATATLALQCSDPDMALNNLERCSDIVDTQALKVCLEHPHYSRQLLLMLGASTFLTGILCRQAEFFDDLFVAGEVERNKDVEVMREELLERLDAAADFAELQRCVRRYKYREVLRISARDLSQVADLVEVTAELSSLAAATLQVACRHCERLLQVECGQPHLDEPDENGQTLATFTVLGMGKFGGWELNFSSDIDLIYFYSSSLGQTSGLALPSGEVKNRLSLHQYFVKLSDMLTRAIGQVTADGFVFRVDLDLRPEGRSGEMACSLRGAETYYESWGQNWERSAMMKARPVAGDLAFGQQLLKALEPFIYRRYLDYGMVEDLKVMKQKIDSRQAQQRDSEHNLKLGKGGIREIEFFIQALQLVFAGKNPQVRERSSLQALYLLRDEGHISAEDAAVLREAYIFLRTVEHRIQVVQERQTHNLPTGDSELLCLARRSGFSDLEGFQQELDRHRDEVTRIYRGLFYADEDQVEDEITPQVRFLLDDSDDSDEPETIDMAKDILEEHGFRDVETAYVSLQRFREGKFGVPMTRRVRRYYQRVLPLLLQEVLGSLEPDMTLANLEEFLLRVRAQGTFYALLAENPGIIQLLIQLFGTSKFLSRIFIQRPELLDSLVSSSYAVDFKSLEVLREELTAQMAQSADYEDQLDTLRRFRNEEFLRIALNDLHGELLQGRSTMQLSCLAIVCLEAAVAMARTELIPRFGLPFVQTEDGDFREAEFAVLGMGKLGGMELNYHSDLDIIFIYSGQGKNRAVEGTEADRFKQITNQEYFSKLAQRIISVLTLSTREGRVYEIDTRLRPSGNQGPLVTSLVAYENYHQESAQLWERQALTKAKVVVGPPGITAQIQQINKRITWEKPLPDELQQEIYRLRGRMEKEIAQEGEDRFNIKTGRGGMVDVEFLVQYFQLRHGCDTPQLRESNTLAALHAIGENGLLDGEAVEVLVSGYKFLRRLENKLRLVHDQSFNQISTDKTSLRKLARRLGYQGPELPEQQFLADYHQVTEQIRALFDCYLKP
ncbi:MAG: bifunctional [glutamate--ammonia ligase]-adenylyl-L-tyrosine phosphorylase/[glutamate--ammonia-ligase] adenylyltransferase [Desulfuromonas sp.]|nr:bifunctional [glutamate--ammonia ligase]-adenylyl-L-tyrosine phosphorylase/[glutamate--ammonia-ligase] adenylyltransferase [Desulfuromonas sp.]